MGYLPIFVELGGQPCVVVGGDAVAEARIRVLLEAGARVTVIGPEVTDWVKLQDAAGIIHYLAREYQYGDLRGNSLAYVTVANPELARALSIEARELGIPLNVKDDSEASTFISPATFRRGNLQIAISTSGASPAMARLIRESLERQIGPEYGLILEILRRARIFLHKRQPDQSVRAGVLKAVAAELVGSIVTLDDAAIDQVLWRHLQASMTEIGFDPHNSAWAGAFRASASGD